MCLRSNTHKRGPHQLKRSFRIDIEHQRNIIAEGADNFPNKAFIYNETLLYIVKRTIPGHVIYMYALRFVVMVFLLYNHEKF